MSSGKQPGESSLRLVKRIGRAVSVALAGLALFLRALSRGKQSEPAVKRAPMAATSPPAPTPLASEPATRRPADDLPPGVHMPHPTIWPLVLSLGITLVALGILTNLVMTALGIVFMIWAIAGWVGDLRHG